MTDMEWINYHHLFYFWTIVQEGSLTKAAARLNLTHPTLSTQLRALEGFLGAELFERRGRRLVLSPFGAEVAAYASDIFRLGSELLDSARGRSPQRRTAFRVGVVGALPKSVTYRLLEPALAALPDADVLIQQGELGALLEALAGGRLHLVLSDAPATGSHPFKVHAHLLGESAVLLYGTRALARRYRKGFPASLEGAPLVLPGAASSLRRLLDRWLADRGLRVQVVGEIDDAGLLRVFGGCGRGLFPVRAALRTEVEESHGAERVGSFEGLRERYYAISIERKVRHRGVAAVIERARYELGGA